MNDKCECGKHLFGEIERDLGICNNCADRAYERHTERLEWEYFHPSASGEASEEASQ